MDTSVSYRIIKQKRAYQVIWDQLKVPPNTVVLKLIDAGFLSRVKRMISKEKDIDKKFKRKQNLPKYLFFSWDAETLELTISLVDCGHQSVSLFL